MTELLKDLSLGPLPIRLQGPKGPVLKLPDRLLLTLLNRTDDNHLVLVAQVALHISLSQRLQGLKRPRQVNGVDVLGQFLRIQATLGQNQLA